MVPLKYTIGILAIYVALFIILGFISLPTLLLVLGIMFVISTIIYVVILIEERIWTYSLIWDNLVGYAAMAYGIVFFLLPIIVLNCIEDRIERNER